MQMKLKRKFVLVLISFPVILAGLVLAILLYVPHADYGFCRPVGSREAQLRMDVVKHAQSFLGITEGLEGHQQIIDTYNAHEPLAQGYIVQPEDNWCAAFGSFVAIELELTDYIPTECGCQRQIDLFMDIERWQESDTYLPQPGDYIYYAWGEALLGECTGWSDHVGIVAGTWGPFIKVIEGNKDDAVSIRYTTRWDPTIRGYGLPDYTAAAAEAS